ncbi:DNA repair and recombination protein rad54b [Branchiostoma belcheri]|nr:DNA repair and recombination protein rad54b [Branchiostoma belcheri]
MRRSAAPSQLHAAKRPRFNPPFAAPQATKPLVQQEPKTSQPTPVFKQPAAQPVATKSQPKHRLLSILETPKTTSQPSSNHNGSDQQDTPNFTLSHSDQWEEEVENQSLATTSSLNSTQLQTSTNLNMENRKQQLRPIPSQKFSTTQKPLAHIQPKHNHDNSTYTGPTEGGGHQTRYYNVMWCKVSGRKHKRWEGDAVLVVHKRSVELLDTEGKKIGGASGYKTTELSEMTEGQTLKVGGKEVEIYDEISLEDWNTGKCFQSISSSSSPDPAPTKVQPKPKPFTNPMKNKLAATQKKSAGGAGAQQTVAPRFDPTAEGVLVMPRPSPAHQWKYNPNGQPLVDVVVDPHLSRHLRPHQRDGVIFLYQCVMGMRDHPGLGAILADSMGLGKTLQCLTLIWTLLKQGPYGGRPVLHRVLIVTPGSLVKNWVKEFKKWLGNERCKVYAVGQDSRVEEFARSPLYPVMIISYEMLVRCIRDIEKINFDLIVCDEGHRLKNTNIKTTSFISGLSARKRIVLTGTPIQNDLQELHSIVDFCNPGVLGPLTAFRKVYEEPIVRSHQPGATEAEKTLGATRAEELSRLTGQFTLRRTEDVNNKYLPPKVEAVVFCRPTPLQLDIYRKLLCSRVLRSFLYSNRPTDGSLHLMCISALKKLCNDPSLIYTAAKEAENQAPSFLEDEDELFGFDQVGESIYQDVLSLFPRGYDPNSASPEYSGKLQVLADLLGSLYSEGPRERIVVVSNYTQTLDMVQELCKVQGYGYLRLDGSTPTGKRQQIVERFNDKYCRDFVFLLSTKAGGVGLNLIGASRLVLYDIDWNPANDLQAMARVWRDGQPRVVHIYRLITTGTIEEKIYQRQISKQGLSGAVVDAKSSGKVQFSAEELKDLFTLHEDTDSVTHDLLDCAVPGGDCSGSPGSDRPQTSTMSRPCQLGQPQSASLLRSNLSMAELLGWTHHRAPLENRDIQDYHLLSAAENISYVFVNETNTSQS